MANELPLPNEVPLEVQHAAVTTGAGVSDRSALGKVAVTGRDRAAFLSDYLAAVQKLCDKYGAKDGLPYRVVLAAHPVTETETGERAAP